MSRCLTILEVSQKQNYIFSSNKVRDNIVNSAVIAYVLGEEYIGKILQNTDYVEEKNMVYSGGGHTILEFPDQETAKRMVALITKRIYCEFDGLTVFAKNEIFDDSEHLDKCLTELTKSLERKKSVRLASFHQGSYGIEKVDSGTMDIVEVAPDSSIEKSEKRISEEKKKVEHTEYGVTAKEFTPDGYDPVYQFDELGGAKNDSNFISVVHIDGNGMGKRVEELYKVSSEKTWEESKELLKNFSKSIDDDFKKSYKEMIKEVAYNLQEKGLNEKLSLKDKKFPVRRIITAGDDICFVTEGRIGIECARIFIQKLTKKENKVDKKRYAACAGVVIVHQKYPFYRAYELAEMLCSNAKKYGAQISPEDNGRRVSAIDWHIEFGELKDSLDEIRQSYTTFDQNRLEMRPYIISLLDKDMDKDEYIDDEKYIAKKYDNFKRIISRIQNNESEYGNGKIKELRSALKQGEVATRNYLIFNKMEDIIVENKPKEDRITELDLMRAFTGRTEKGMAFVLMSDNKKHSILYDSIELMDSYIALEGGE